ncbi:MAG: hypothetical protein M1818_003528 [Claussenomyces sp. TS43310]|nr:MAG: hypothetical protein M1818_003528 [Claussenomyces sp. TS43310]
MATTNGSFNQQDQYKSGTEQYTATQGATDAAHGSTNGNTDLSKDEIGWYFVEQYYTTLSRSPEKLHLFYGKRSQFVSGLEAEVSNVSVGRSAIQERIKSLDFQDCKVRVSNVDSQASDENIVIQVIGETSNKSAELKKFVQTFVLAQQPSGYFVLNDVFRYIKEESEEEAETGTAQDEQPQAAQEELTEDVEMPKAQPAAEETATETLDTGIVNEKLETVVAENPAVAKDASATNGSATEEHDAVEEPAAAETAAAEEPALSPEDVEKEIADEDAKEAEKPRDPVPTPSVSRQPSSAKAPAQYAAPAKQLSWANRAAAAAAAAPTPRPAVPAPKATSPVQTQNRAPPAAQPAQSTPAPAASTEVKENDVSQQSGWQTAGSDNAKRQNRPQSVSGPQEKEGTMGYVRGVTEVVKSDELRAALSKFGELVYFDVNRQKNCAFVEFASTAGYQAASAANPLKLSGEDIFVEPRRPKSSAYGGSGYIGGRGGMNTRGRGGFDGRSGSQRGRGDFANRGRGAPRGRGGNAAPTAA